MFAVAKTQAVVGVVEFEFTGGRSTCHAAARRGLIRQVRIGDVRVRGNVQRRREAGEPNADFENQDADSGDNARGGEHHPACGRRVLRRHPGRGS
jgi:hypothetical protein